MLTLELTLAKLALAASVFLAFLTVDLALGFLAFLAVEVTTVLLGLEFS